MALLSALLAALSVVLGAAPRPVLPVAAPTLRPGCRDPGSGAVPAPARAVVPTRSLHALAALGTALAVALLVPGLLGLAGAVGAGGLVWLRSSTWESSAVRRRRATLEAELPVVVDLMAAALSAGADPARALGDVAHAVGGVTGAELAPLRARLELGADPVSVWSELAGHPVFGRLGSTLRRSVDSGAPVAPALERLARDLRARRRAEVETRVRQVEVKAAVPLGVCLLPSFVLLGVVPLVAGSVTRFLLAG